MANATSYLAVGNRRTACSWQGIIRLDKAWIALGLLLAECWFLFFYGLSGAELYRTETLRAIIGAEFLRTGNWIVPTLYGEPLFTKPPGMYAAIALASLPAGKVTELSARLPSAIAATTAVLLFFWFFRRHYGTRAGLLAAGLLPLSFMWLDKGNAAEIDMMQTAWVCGAILFFLRAMEIEQDLANTTAIAVIPGRPARLQATLWSMASLLCVAGGVLTKWTAPAFFYLMAIPYLWRCRRLSYLLSLRHVFPALLAASICFVWVALAVHRSDWHVWHDTVSREALMRLFPSHHPKPYPWQDSLLHPMKILAMNVPWSLCALYALAPQFCGMGNFRQRRVILGLHCWVWPNLVFWSVIPEHAFRHSFPLFPGISGLASVFCIAWLHGTLPEFGVMRLFGSWRPHMRLGPCLIGLAAFWIVIKLAFVHIVAPSRDAYRQTRTKAEVLAASIPLGCMLYVSALKDEGLMFYYGRPVRRVAALDQLPSSVLPAYCILDKLEWERWQCPERTTVVQRLKDAQDAPIVLVRLNPLSSK
jgi:4-amino-4-deoxy-L-arabinose transferase-like glycosyltransferase